MLIPERLKKFPVYRGYVVHGAVFIRSDGTPDFTVMHGENRLLAIKEHLCHICLEKLDPIMIFIVDDFILAKRNKLLTDGPMHEECALFAVETCPYLKDPNYVPSKPRLSKGEDIQDIAIVPPRPSRMAFYYTNDYEYCEPCIRPYPPIKLDWNIIPRRESC